MSLNKYEIIKQIGKGHFGEVFLAKHKKDGKLYAIKIVPDIEEFETNIERENKNLKKLEHPNILRFIEQFEENKKIHIVTEYCNGGSLKNCKKLYKNKYGTYFSPEIIQHIMRQILNALVYMHDKNIIHRDIKLDNILLNFENEKDCDNLELLNAQVKLIDFGLSIKTKDLASGTCGTPLNAAPEILRRFCKISHEEYDYKVDIWSLGTIVYEMLFGRSIFDGKKTYETILEVINKGEYTLPEFSYIEVASFLDCTLRFDPKERKTPKELARHFFIVKQTKSFSLLENKTVLNFQKDNKKSIFKIFDFSTDLKKYYPFLIMDE